MKCFVIMPFHDDFDDVYEAIEQAATQAGVTDCFRLDHRATAGRILPKLEQSIQSSDLCVADLSANRPNVMWEIGYAMGLGKQVILLSQHDEPLDFDIQDMHRTRYRRTQLGKLRVDLQAVIERTVRELAGRNAGRPADPIVDLQSEVMELKGLVRELVGSHRANSLYAAPAHGPSLPAWQSRLMALDTPEAARARDLVNRSPKTLAGRSLDLLFAGLSKSGAVFREQSSGSVGCVRRVAGRWLLPYCYGGDDRLVGLYHDFDVVQEHVFGRFLWFHQPISGFAFFEPVGIDRLSGRWFLEGDEEAASGPEGTGVLSGTKSEWEVQPGASVPEWAESFFRSVEANGLRETIARVRGLR